VNADGTDQKWADDDCRQEHQVDWGTASLD
jgi:hypothetical protein